MPRITTRKLKPGPDSGPQTGQSPPLTGEKPDKSQALAVLEAPIEEEFDNPDQPPPVPASTISPLTATPRPPFFKYESEGIRGHTPNDFFSYWSKLDPEFQKRQTAYVYRNWPVIEIMVPDKKNGGMKPACQIAKVPGEDPIRDLDDMLHRFGSGDYTIRLNDCTLKKSIALCMIRGLRSEDHPAVPPPEKNWTDVLVMDDPANRSFVQYLKMKGVLQEEKREEQEMTDGKAVDRLATVIEKQMERQATQPQGPNLDATAAAKGMEIVSHAATMGSQIVEKAMERAGELQAKGQDPTVILGVVDKIVTVIQAANSQANRGSGDGATSELVRSLLEREGAMRKEIAEMNSNLFKLQTDRISSLEQDVRAARAAPQPVPGPASSVFDGLDRLLEVKSKLDDLTGAKEEAAIAPRIPWWAELAKTALNVIPAIGAAAVQASYNLAIARGGPGAPAAVPMMPQPNPEIQMPGIEAGSAPGTDGGPEMKSYMAMLKQIEVPLIRSLNEGKSGDQFALDLVNWFGQTGYDFIHEKGKQTISDLLHSYPPIATVIQGIPQRWEVFLDEFMRAEEIWAAEDKEPEGPVIQPS